ncbi:sigma-70 family RNA polymerase sigma factor [Jatrophihabitans sp.]|uniref:sigma-70 family RNA polymerase sigma factor n=1 Tax=Jatrophihabitans sp. TaxID=1932789 RepID=UPI002BC96D48|nr:sigma-70 family RNA polymerase sigma factor [Jatrophihabitans sp.]
MSATLSPGPDPGESGIDIGELLALVRRVVTPRVPDPATADDLVQETLTRVLDAGDRVTQGMHGPYAIVTARNLVSSFFKQQETQRRNQHRLAEPAPDEHVDQQLLDGERRAAMATALTHLSDRDRQALVAHEVDGQDTGSLGTQLGMTAGAVAAQLHRARARLRVEYLLALERMEPPTDRCRQVLYALSARDRRRQRELDAARHLLECDLCPKISRPLFERTADSARKDVIEIRRDADIVTARQAVREVASGVGFSRTDATIIATAVSEITRNIVRFAERGELSIEVIEEDGYGVLITARDTGPGIPDVERAMVDGYSTYSGLGLGLPGARRLMDEFEVVSEVGRGTTVTMIKWLKGNAR